ncbi:MAG TPA: type II secretion system protein GspI [Gammaproteobacteria bacterium]|jgi:general secretion pathway protein I|nr:type II secretion system protein GspI [Gammaproteobacteria bacterium]
MNRDEENKLLGLPKGFTLIEVLVALAIVAVALAAVLNSSSAHTRNLTYLKEKTLAHWVASNQLMEAELSANGWPAVGVSTGNEELAGHSWYWRRQVSLATEINGKEMRRVDVAVYFDERVKQAHAQVSGFIIR